MNERNTIQNPTPQNGVETQNPQKGNITPIQFGAIQTKTPIVEDKDFNTRAKAFEPCASAVIRIFDSAGYRAVLRKAEAIVEDETRAERICEKVRLDKDTITATKEAGGRIMARHFESTEAADWTVVASALANWSFGLYDVVSELRKIAEEKEAREKNRLPKIGKSAIEQELE